MWVKQYLSNKNLTSIPHLQKASGRLLYQVSKRLFPRGMISMRQVFVNGLIRAPRYVSCQRCKTGTVTI